MGYLEKIDRSIVLGTRLRGREGSVTLEQKPIASGKKTKPFFFYFHLKPREKWLKMDVSDSKKSNIPLLFFLMPRSMEREERRLGRDTRRHSESLGGK